MMPWVNFRSSHHVARQASATFARSRAFHCPCWFSSGASTLAPATVFRFLCPLSRAGPRKVLLLGFRTRLRRQGRSVAAEGAGAFHSAKPALRSGTPKEKLRRF